jgi:hypothetical protein
MMLEPKDTLDAMTTAIPAPAALLLVDGRRVVNGPEDHDLGWGRGGLALG